MVSSVQKTEAIIKKLLEISPANDRNAFIISGTCFSITLLIFFRFGRRHEKSSQSSKSD